ncbi:putative DDE superfamily endonuclease domain-containing protein [Helianthus annuus]|nr:putative DDE superfamily endonuclease domain-containing protein [Helianthus annuus]
MTGVLFEEYVRQLDKKMVRRKILLIVDNCPAHPKIIEGLRNVELFFFFFFCHQTQLQKFNLVMRGSYELLRCIIVVDFIEVFRHCKLRSTDNMTFENSDEGGESTRELQNLIKELGYRNAMDVEDVLTHPEENVVAQLLTDGEIIESVIGINKDDIDEEDDESSTVEPPSRNEAIKAAITLNNFLLSYEKTTPEVLTMLRKIRDEIQGETDFNKKQKTIESFFKKPS